MENLDTIDKSRSQNLDDALFQAGVLSLGVIWSRNVSLIGASARLRLDKAGKATLCRFAPEFTYRDGERAAPLGDRHVSRSPVVIEKLSDDKFAFTPPASRMSVALNGTTIDRRSVVSLKELGDEIVITLAKSIILCLYYGPARKVVLDQGNEKIIGGSRPMAMVKDVIARVSANNAPVLIRGETGTGKELVAHAIHQNSARAGKPMLCVNMATLSPSIASAELFGVKRGAFTGATADKKGLFEQAHGGVIFLDEIGETPPDVQTMLLRVLENGEVRRVGDDHTRKVDVRIIAATDRSLQRDDGKTGFNQPLLQRLETFSIELAPLRTRRIDIGALVLEFLNEEAEGLPKIEAEDLSIRVISDLVFHAWPGNVRELRNAVFKIRCGQRIALTRPDASSVPHEDMAHAFRESSVPYRHPSTVSDAELIKALDQTGWVIKDAAAELNVSRTTLYSLMASSSKVRNIDDVTADELRTLERRHPNNISLWAKELRVGKDALRKKLRSMER